MTTAVSDPVTGYYRFPTIHGDTIAFVAEDDVWTIPIQGGVAHRLTANPGRFTHPVFSPDGKWLAITGTDEGQTEVYVMPGGGGPARRLTYFGPSSFVVGWRPDSSRIVFASDAKQPHLGHWHPYEVGLEGGDAHPLNVGPTLTVSFDPDGDGKVLGRTGGGRRRGDPAMWKRYRGGTAGTLWIDPTGKGRFKKLIELDGDLASPMWIGKRIYFLSDHEGIGNLYSCRTSGKDLRRETHHEQFYVRYPKTDGQRIVYTNGADLYVFEVETGETTTVDIALPSARPQRNRKFVSPRRYTTDYAVHPKGHKAHCCRTRDPAEQPSPPYQPRGWGANDRPHRRIRRKPETAAATRRCC